jgi:hypothetical protein
MGTEERRTPPIRTLVRELAAIKRSRKHIMGKKNKKKNLPNNKKLILGDEPIGPVRVVSTRNRRHEIKSVCKPTTNQNPHY